MYILISDYLTDNLNPGYMEFRFLLKSDSYKSFFYDTMYTLRKLSSMCPVQNLNRLYIHFNFKF